MIITGGAPNRAFTWSPGEAQESLVRRSNMGDVVVYSVPKGFILCTSPGTPRPHHLILVNEYSDHSSVQPSIAMSLKYMSWNPCFYLLQCADWCSSDLDQKITNFVLQNG